MGKLITLTEINSMTAYNATWFFNDAYYTSDGRGGYVFDWPSKDFPYHFCIHSDDISLDGRKLKIRRWIENTISDTVIFDTIDNSYKKYYGKTYEWDKNYSVRNTWYRFSFENENTALMFKLAFSDCIKPMTKWHPDHPDDEEYLSRSLEDRYIKD